MKRGPSRSHGILVSLFGIVVGVLGILKATILPSRGLANWYLALFGLVSFAAGVVFAMRGDREDALARDDARSRGALPRARVHRR